MKHLLILAALLFLEGMTSCKNSSSENSTPIRKVVFVIVDGIPEDVIQSVKTPILDEIISQGAFIPAYVGGGAGTYSETPTISAVGYNSLLTGTWANKHNTLDNNIENPNYHYWSIFRILKEQFPGKKTAVFSTWLDNRTKLIGAGLPQTKELTIDYYFDGFEYDTLRFPHDEDSQYILDIDNYVVEEAGRVLRSQAPDLSWVYLQYTDNMGHSYGDHPRFEESVRLVDAQLSHIWDAVKERMDRYNEEWMLLITTDHGRTADTGKDHGGQTERERRIWIATNIDEINSYGRSHRVGITDILPSIAHYMGISIPKAQGMELDGVPFIGPVDVANLEAQKSGNRIEVYWKNFSKNDTGRLWISTSNHFKTGGEDRYFVKGDVPLSDEYTSFSVEHIPSPFYKIVLQTPNHYSNTWIVPE